ncbi:hypothetical protein [Mycoplasma sp. SG1]|uniref:hypothetical protein n=1 Tax=Mycoplasma sp. SG1 TaxID=2810348 RepID=UPI002023D4E0|nr:hypothetical protein [Mycoplasma sp. SG1]URM53061.1 hypothetical protein JRW51_01805 [Mycoplasma sp. SG1]
MLFLDLLLMPFLKALFNSFVTFTSVFGQGITTVGVQLGFLISVSVVHGILTYCLTPHPAKLTNVKSAAVPVERSVFKNLFLFIVIFMIF